jgi:peptidoglycan/xylan/chitin deacetylase (PgdA/CDA1 family)
MADRLLVFGWHNVEGSWAFPNAAGRGAVELARQFQLLKSLANVVPLAEALQDLTASLPLPPRAVAITFDDGYRDNLDMAVPLLRQLELPATFFLVPGILSGEIQAWWETLAWAFQRSSKRSINWEEKRLPLDGPVQRHRVFEGVAERLKLCNRAAREQAIEELVGALAPAGPGPRLFLDWDDARELARGGFTIGSHSEFHAILSQETPKEQHRDLLASRQQLERELQVPVDLFAYPNGRACDYDQDTMEAARQAGYSFAVTTISGSNRPATPPYEIRRSIVEPQVSGIGLVGRAVQGWLMTHK